MIGGNEFAFAYVRMQARLGARPTESAWDSLLASVGFHAFLERARASPLAPWLSSVGPGAHVHEIESILRRRLRERFEEVAGWVPGQWRDAVRWSVELVDLPAVEHLLAGHETQAWMLEDRALAPLAGADPQTRRAVSALAAGAPFAQPDAQVRPGDRWLAAWRARMPPIAPAQARRVERLVKLARTHAETFAHDPARSAHASWAVRRTLERSLFSHFRRAFLEPAAVFAFLLLVALEFEKLRGALVSRVLFGETR